MFQAIRNSKDRLDDFHVADNNRMACGMGHCDWAKIIGTLKEIGYDGALTVEFVAPVDRTPANPYKNALETGPRRAHRRRAEVHRGPRQRARCPTSSTRGSSPRRSRRCGSTCSHADAGPGRPEQSADGASRGWLRATHDSSMKSVLLIGTLDTKGPEIALRARPPAGARRRHHRRRLAASSAGPLDIVPDVSRAEVARLGGHDHRGAARGREPRRSGARHAARAAAARARPVPRGPARRRADARRRRGRRARRQRHDGPARSASPRSSSRPSPRGNGGSGRWSAPGT